MAEGNGKVTETVEMTDGRKVEFVGTKRKMLKEIVLDPDGSFSHVRFDFRNGETRAFAGNEKQNGQALGHGWSQKIGDDAAGEDDVDDMVMAIDQAIERAEKGVWYMERESGGMSGTSILLRALVEFSGKSVDYIKAYLKDKSVSDKKAMRVDTKHKNAKGLTLKDVVERLEAEKAAKAAGKGQAIDVDGLFAELSA
jgi:hypothetical protein